MLIISSFRICGSQQTPKSIQEIVLNLVLSCITFPYRKNAGGN